MEKRNVDIKMSCDIIFILVEILDFVQVALYDKKNQKSDYTN